MTKATQGRPKLTAARQRAVEVLARAPRRAARESNETSDPAAVNGHGETPRIYWQSRAWLSDNGLIEAIPGRPNWYQLTDAGVELAAQLGLGGPCGDGPVGKRPASVAATVAGAERALPPRP